uniref:Uncharacterized protein n=1 Tax=Arundo donax TaxID=35708 RepID=A0A0A8XZN2_ARUDO
MHCLLSASAFFHSGVSLAGFVRHLCFIIWTSYNWYCCEIAVSLTPYYSEIWFEFFRSSDDQGSAKPVHHKAQIGRCFGLLTMGQMEGFEEPSSFFVPIML